MRKSIRRQLTWKEVFPHARIVSEPRTIERINAAIHQKPEGANSEGFGATDAPDQTEKLLAAFSTASAIGFAICDDQFRFLGVNNALAAINGISARAHAGNTLRDILGEAAAKVEPAWQRVLATNRVLDLEVTAVLPTRTEPGYWIAHYFPIENGTGRPRRAGALVIEVSESRKLEESLRKQTGELPRRRNQQRGRVARELHDAINEYEAALTTSLGVLSRDYVESNNAAEILAQSITSLDERIAAMRTFVSLMSQRINKLVSSQAG
jgi:PAS domain-containing protein